MQAEQERGEERYDKEGKRGRGGIALEQVLESRKSVASANLEINRGKSVERDGSNGKWSKLISFGSRPKDETPEVSRHGSRSFSLLDGENCWVPLSTLLAKSDHDDKHFEMDSQSLIIGNNWNFGANDFESSFQDSCIGMHFEAIGELVNGISTMII